jgi:drug/metabolite transporter (DMT)-like permease
MEFLSALYIFVIVVAISAQHISKKAYSVRTGGEGGALTFSLGSVSSALLFFVFSSGFSFDFDPSIIPYSIGFGLTYGSAVVFSFYAIKYGPLSLTSLISSYSLIIPTFYGIFFLNEETGIALYVGLLALMISLFLVNFKISKKDGDVLGKTKKTDPRWYLFVALSFIGNGGCSTVQNVHQRSFEGKFKNEFMILALAIVAVIFAVVSLIAERKEMKRAFAKGWYFMLICGGFNGLCNLLVMLCSVLMSASVMFPIISAGGIILTAIVSILFYKEKLTRMQYAGFVLGILAIVLLNI